MWLAGKAYTAVRIQQSPKDSLTLLCLLPISCLVMKSDFSLSSTVEMIQEIGTTVDEVQVHQRRENVAK